MKRKQLTPVVIGVVWLISLGVVFVLGILSAFAFHLAPGSGSASAGDLTLDQRDLVLLVERHTGEPPDIASLFSLTDDNTVPEQLDLTLRSVMRENDPEVRSLAAERMVRGLPQRRIMGAIRFLQEIPSSPARDQLLSRFLEAWASRDGRSAIAFSTSLNSLRERELAIGAALRGWSRDRPADAWNWVVERAVGTRRSERWLEIILRNLGTTDRETAFQLIGQLPSEDFQVQMAMVVMDQILQMESPQEALLWVGELPEAATGPAATFIAEQWAVDDPEAAASWLSRAFPSELDGLSTILREWAYAYPEEAAEWCWDRYSGQVRREFIQVVAEEWVANSGPTPLAQWLNTHGQDPTLDGAIESLAIAALAVDPETALVWAQSITDPDTRSMLEIYIGKEWIRQAPDEAAQVLPVVLQSETARAALLQPQYEAYEEEEFEDTGIDESALPMDAVEEDVLPVQ